jgi:hypothetical protein
MEGNGWMVIPDLKLNEIDVKAHSHERFLAAIFSFWWMW